MSPRPGDPVDGTRFDVVAMGNALVDVLSRADDAFLAQRGLVKGSMRLVDAEEAAALYDQMGPGVESSGGSAANTAHGLASLGGRGAFLGKVAADQLGTVFAHDLRAAGVHFGTPPALSGIPTGRCLILVTPDAQRTLNTFLGVSASFDPGDVDEAVIGDSAVLYLEGYLFDEQEARDAFRHAAAAAHRAGRRVALTLSDGFCVARHREEFRHLVEHEVDVLFANEDEILSLYEVDRFDEALQRVNHHCEVAALTRSEKGAVIVSRDQVHVVDAHPVAEVVDTTGAGDLFAAGFLYGYTRHLDLELCGRLGALCAAEVIAHVGARPEVSLAGLARRAGLLSGG